jgi:diamine N-acetyltransferase
MDARTRRIVKDLLLKKAAEDPAFRQALLDDHGAAIKATFGQDIPEGVELRVVEETPELVYLVLPLPAPTRDSVVTLREITRDSVRSVIALETTPEQKQFVAPNAVSVAEAHFSPLAWMRAIYADETPVGFVLLSDDPEKTEYYLWRYMVGTEYQGLGFGFRALQLVVDYVRSRPGAKEMLLSYVPGDGCPRDFYARMGFVDTGEQHGGENVMRLEF